jgi:hypothetical protein
MARVQPDKMGNASSIFNLLRNIGGSVGIAVMTTFLARRTQLHQNHLVANVPAGNPKTLQLLRGMQANFYAQGADAVTGSRKAIAGMYGLVQQHAAMLAFVEAFWLMGVVFLLMFHSCRLLNIPNTSASRYPRASPSPNGNARFPNRRPGRNRWKKKFPRQTSTWSCIKRGVGDTVLFPAGTEPKTYNSRRAHVIH